MKFEQYRNMDLALLSVMAVLAEVLGIWLHKELPMAGFYISFSTLIALISLLRWGKQGALVNCLISVPIVLFSEQKSGLLFLFYFISGLAVVIIPILFGRIETSRVVGKSYWLLLYVAAFYSVVILSRGLFGFIVGLSFVSALVQTFSQLLFSMVMSYIVLIVIKNREGLLVNMRTYFISKQEESEE